MWARWFVTLALISGCDQVWGLARPDEPAVPPGTWRSVTAGDVHTCGIRTDGTLWCWGSDEAGQIANPDLEVNSPAQIGAARWLEVSGRGATTCAIAEDHSLWCFGANINGQLGVGAGHPGLNQVAGGPWEHVEAAGLHTCAIATDTTLWCWGDNSYGELGDGTNIGSLVPVPVALEARDHWRSITLGAWHTCGIRDDDSLWCWGQALYGALADPNLAPGVSQLVPNRVRGTWVKVAAGALHSCAISTDGHLRCWGYNASGELGDGTTSQSYLGVDVGGQADDWVDLIAGYEHNCGARKSGELYCWGDNRHGQIPNGDVGDIASTPVPIDPRVAPWTGAHGLGVDHSCLIDSDNRLACVGGNSDGQLGRGSGTHLRPAKLDGEWVDVASAEAFTCALDVKRDAYCWGDSASSALGDGTVKSHQVPTKIAEAGPWEAISAGGGAACVKRSTSRWCWGSNAAQQLGIASAPYLYLPKEITDDRFPQSMRYHLCSINGGALSCWGAAMYGQLGLGDTNVQYYPAPVLVPPVTWTLVGVGNYHTCAVATDGLYCWGYNGYGELGNGSNVDRHQPTLAVSGTFDSLAVGYEGACVIARGNASCWGYGGAGALGTGTLDDANKPLAIGGSWRSLAMSQLHTCGIAADGSLWCWGANAGGRLGDGTLTARLAPVQIDASRDWEKLALGRRHSCALKTDHTLWCWGANGTGEVGDGTSWSADLQLVD